MNIMYNFEIIKTSKMDIIDNCEIIIYKKGDIVKYDFPCDYDEYYDEFDYYRKGDIINRKLVTVYYVNGVCHRYYKDGPAVIGDLSDWYKFTRIYVKNGIIDRPISEGPAIFNSSEDPNDISDHEVNYNISEFFAKQISGEYIVNGKSHGSIN